MASETTQNNVAEIWPNVGFFMDRDIAGDKSLTLAERFILGYVASFNRQNKPCFASAEHMAVTLGLNESYLKNVRAGLVEKGRLKRFERDGRVFFAVELESSPDGVGNSYGGCRKNLHGGLEIPTGGLEIPTGGVGNSNGGGWKNQPQGLEIPTHIVKNIIKPIEKSIERVSTPPPPQGTKEWFQYQAEKSLAEPTGNETWEKDNQFIAAGRRPMTKFPGLWFTTAELADAIEVVMESLPPDADIKPVFALAQAEALTKLADRSAKKVSAYKYVTGYCLQQIADTLRKSAYLQNSRSK